MYTYTQIEGVSYQPLETVHEVITFCIINFSLKFYLLLSHTTYQLSLMHSILSNSGPLNKYTFQCYSHNLLNKMQMKVDQNSPTKKKKKKYLYFTNYFIPESWKLFVKMSLIAKNACWEEAKVLISKCTALYKMYPLT